MGQDVFGIAGTTQGTFTIEEAVAEGGFGVVYRALHGAFRAPVALKCLKIPTIPEDLRAGFLERFREEAEMLFRLSATIPEVVRPLHYDVISLDSGLIVPFIALEWLEGHTLWSLIEQRAQEGKPPLSYLEAARILTPVARALQIAHNFPGPSGPVCVVHRDIKPANIFLAQLHGAEVIKILDFGIARARDAASLNVGQVTQDTTSIPLAFTPRYGAPEQWAPKRFGTTGPWTDVWGLAITFLECVAGRVVIDGDAVAIMGTVLDEKRRPTPRSEGVVVPDALEAVFRRAVAVDPRERPPNAGAFWDEVEQAIGIGMRVSTPGELRRSGIMRALSLDAPVDGRSPSGTMRAVNPDAPGEIRRSSQSLRAVNPANMDVASTLLAEQPAEAPPTRISRVPDAPLVPSVPREIDLAAAPKKALPSNIDLDWGSGAASAPQRRSSTSLQAVRVPEEPTPLERERERHSIPTTTSVPPPAEPAPDVRSMLGVPVALTGLGVALRVLDSVASSLWFHGEPVSLGPLRLTWVAALFIGAGALLALARLLKHVAR